MFAGWKKASASQKLDIYLLEPYIYQWTSFQLVVVRMRVTNIIDNEYNDCIEVTHGMVFSNSSLNSQFNALECSEKCNACQ